MSNILIQQIMTSRYRTSVEADRLTVSLMSNLGLSTKANIARLAIGRSLAQGVFATESVDSKGLEIPASVLFTQDDIAVWTGLIVAHAKVHGGPPVDSMDSFREAVRKHWHRGAKLLQADWDASSGDFDKFLDTLIVRRADLPDVADARRTKREPEQVSQKPEEASAELIKALANIGVGADIKGFKHGPRVTRYRVFLPDVNQFDKLRRGLERLAISLNLQKAIPNLSQGDEANTVNIDVPRMQSSWTSVDVNLFKTWLSGPLAKDAKLAVFPGVDVMGQPYYFDLSNAPHLLVGGTTGSGKSVCLHALILSLVSRLSPQTLQLALIDPKQVEFNVYRSEERRVGKEC